MSVSTGQGVGGDANIEMIFVIPSLTKLLATFGRPVIAEDPETGEEFLELHLPVEKNACRNDLVIMLVIYEGTNGSSRTMR